jgi:outer membrane usher protein FimD/PapC
LVEARDGKPSPLEFREFRLIRGDTVLQSFTARRGEFYVEGVEPGEYLLQQDAGIACSVRIRVPDLTEAIADIGTAVCQPAPR